MNSRLDRAIDQDPVSTPPPPKNTSTESLMGCHSGGGGRESSGVESPGEPQGEPVPKQRKKTKNSESIKTTNSS